MSLRNYCANCNLKMGSNNKKKYCLCCEYITFSCPDCGKEVIRKRTVIDTKIKMIPGYVPACSQRCSSGRIARDKKTQYDLGPLDPDPKILTAWQEEIKEIRLYRPPFRPIGWEWDLPQSYHEPVTIFSVKHLV